jgi:multicomponent Na+:H+ antiporter subunit B
MTFDPLQALDVAFLAMLLIVAVAIVRMRSLFAVAMLMGVYSLVAALWYVALDAVDVAFTEAAVGAGISTVLMLGAMLLTAREARPVQARRKLGPLAAAIAAGAALFYALPDLPPYGAADTPANAGVGLEYLERTAADTHVPNVVTAVLASYRGFDTLGETTVIVTAGIAVLLLLGSGRRRREDEEAPE